MRRIFDRMLDSVRATTDDGGVEVSDEMRVG